MGGPDDKDHAADIVFDEDSTVFVSGYFWWSVDLGRPFVLTGIRITTAWELCKF